VAYDPLALFANGEPGAWYDPSDLSTLFQDVDGAIPVTADGQPVGLVLDKSGNGYNCYQTIASKKPVYRIVEGLPSLEFDGIDDFLSVHSQATLPEQGSFLIGTSFTLVDKSQSNEQGLVSQYVYTDGRYIVRFSPGSYNGLADIFLGGMASQPKPTVNKTDTAIVRREGDVHSLSLKSGTSSLESSRGITQTTLRIGTSTGFTSYLNGNIYGFVLRHGSSNEHEVTGTEEYLTALSTRDFKPDHLFENNEVGTWYEYRDMETLFQDAEGTIPVTADGQQVGKILDKSGNGNHATQSVASKRPTYRDVDGVQWLEFDQIDDKIIIPYRLNGVNTLGISYLPDAAQTDFILVDSQQSNPWGITGAEGNSSTSVNNTHGANEGLSSIRWDSVNSTVAGLTRDDLYNSYANSSVILAALNFRTIWPSVFSYGKYNTSSLSGFTKTTGYIMVEGTLDEQTSLGLEEYLTALTVPAGIQQQLSLIAATQYSVTGTTRVERPLNTDIITIVTSQAPDAKPVARSVVVTTFYQDLIRVPNYNVPELVFGGSNTIKSGVGEVMSPLILCNTTNTTAIIDVESYRYLENIKYYFIKNLPIPPYETISIPLNGEFFKTGDMLQIKGDLESGVHAIISFTLGQSEENDV